VVVVAVYQRAGSSVYQARINVGGKLQRISTGRKDQREAEEAAELEERRRNEALIQAGDVYLSQAADRFFSEKQLAVRTVGDYEKSLVNILEILGDFPIRLLTEERVGYYVNLKLKRSGPVQVRRDLAFLSSVLSLARHWDCGVKRNPVKDYDKTGIPEARKHNRWLTPAEVTRLLAACNRPVHYRFILLALHTGMRHRELLGLTWDEIDLDKRAITLQGDRTKNSEGRIIPLSDEVIDTLSDTPEVLRFGYVFKGRKEDNAQDHMWNAWKTIRVRANLPQVRIHDLRHTFASWLKQAGVAETTIMAIMGHKTRSMVARYSHDSLDSLRAAISVLNGDTFSDTQAADKRKKASVSNERALSSAVERLTFNSPGVQALPKLPRCKRL
jgi:integrase